MEVKTHLMKSKFSGFLVGILVGAAILGLFLLGLNFFTSPKDIDTSTKSSQINFSVTSPKSNLATNQEHLEIKGSVNNNFTLITVVTEIETKTIEAKNGSFSTKVALREGLNLIRIVAFDLKKGEGQAEQRAVLYLKDELANL